MRKASMEFLGIRTKKEREAQDGKKRGNLSHEDDEALGRYLIE